MAAEQGTGHVIVAIRPSEEAGHAPSVSSPATQPQETKSAELGPDASSGAGVGVGIGYGAPSLCQMCLEDVPASDQFRLRNCGHSFCAECLEGLCEAEISENQLALTCPWQAEEVKGEDEDEDDGVCGQPIAEEDVLLCCSEETAAKFRRFKENANPLLRRCPECDHGQLGSAEQPHMVCEECAAEFCFKHANAHPGSSCAEYEAQHAQEEAANAKAIADISKPCPSCGSNVMKSSGCNHMKCSMCHTHWCWVCGQGVGTAAFPDHFQWWNVNGCPMNQKRNGTGVGGCITNVLVLILLLPAVVLALATSIACCCCFSVRAARMGWQGVKQLFLDVLSFWGWALMCAPCVLPCLPCCGIWFLHKVATDDKQPERDAGDDAADKLDDRLHEFFARFETEPHP